MYVLEEDWEEALLWAEMQERIVSMYWAAVMLAEGMARGVVRSSRWVMLSDWKEWRTERVV